MPTLPNKTQTKSPNPSNPPSRTNSIKKSSSKLPSNPPSRTNSLKGKPSKLKPTNSIKVNSCKLLVCDSEIWKSSSGHQIPNPLNSSDIPNFFWCKILVFYFPKTNEENNSTWAIIVGSKVKFFRSFLGELKVPKRHFEINWPLTVKIEASIHIQRHSWNSRQFKWVYLLE